MFRSVFIVFLALGAAGSGPSGALAQPVQMGPALPGVCLFSRTAALGASRAAADGERRLQQLIAGVNAELNPQNQVITQEDNAVQAQRGSLTADEYQKRLEPVRRRAEAYAALRQTRIAQLQKTKTLAEQAIYRQMEPVLEAAVVSHRCSVVLERGGAYLFNGAMDLTDQVRIGLDQRMPTIQFDLAAPDAAPVNK